MEWFEFGKVSMERMVLDIFGPAVEYESVLENFDEEARK